MSKHGFDFDYVCTRLSIRAKIWEHEVFDLKSKHHLNMFFFTRAKHSI